MSKKIMLLALTAVSAAMFALPAVASAGAPTIDLSTKNTHFTVSGPGGELRTTGGDITRCTSVTGTGNFNQQTGATKGTLELTFHGCTEETIGTSCTTPGQSTGTIKTGPLTFDTVYRTAGKTAPGVLITPPASGPFATFVCGFGLVHIAVGGNGIIGAITAPGCGGTAASASLAFAQTNGVQAFRHITGVGTTYSLTSSKNGAAPVQAGMTQNATLKLSEGTATLTCV